MADAGAVDALIADLATARAEFMRALDDVDPALATAPGLVGEWSARELVAHLGYWCGHATEALHLVTQGRLAEFVDPDFDVDARNATVARVARETGYATVRAREEASYAALLDLVRRLSPEILDEVAPYGATIEQILLDNGSEHYREHTGHLRAWFLDAQDEEPDDEDEEETPQADPGVDGRFG